MVVALAGNIVAGLAKGLRKHYHTYASAVSSIALRLSPPPLHVPPDFFFFYVGGSLRLYVHFKAS